MPAETAAVRVVRTTVLAASPAAVWRALTDPAELAEWLAEAETLELERGGRALFAMPDGERRDVVFDAVEPERRLSFRWRADDGRDAVSSVELRLEQARRGTRLTVVERVPGTDAGPAARAWGARLELLQRALFLVAV